MLRELLKLPRETEWIEFKLNQAEPQEIGEYLSALANAAALAGKPMAYMAWGVDNESHDVLGTQFRPAATKVGNEELENWLLRLLTPKIQFQFHELLVDGHRAVLLEIDRATHQPVQFQGHEYMRIGTYKKRLKDFPEKERALWRLFDSAPFEHGIAADRASDDDVLGLLDYPTYCDLLRLPLPSDKQQVLSVLAGDELIKRSDGGGWSITNVGAMLFAKRLNDFQGLRRKAVRVIEYDGIARLKAKGERVGTKGYASGFGALMTFVNSVVPSNEVVGQALRKTVPMYPPSAVRELVANALIHQDFFVTGAGPTVEIFANRMEVTNPGKPLIAIDRFLDSPPRSRNEALASLARRMGMCEERGSGVDKVVFDTEFFQLPAPLFEVADDSTRAVLFAHIPLARMGKDDRVRACYLHACLKYVNREYLTNTSLRQRFGIEPHNSAAASRLIREAVIAGMIAPVDEEASKRLMKYAPWWAASGPTNRAERHGELKSV
ncbi:MAG TPA: ATP-binding protein [Myxococcaceae bacterium]|nr:ATP-binding protein [Myxococcaceae bacterium]